MSEMIERVAQAIAGRRECEIECIDPLICSCRSDARAAIEAMKEPTDAMVGAGVKGWKANGYMSIQWVWPSMIDEALR